MNPLNVSEHQLKRVIRINGIRCIGLKLVMRSMPKSILILGYICKYFQEYLPVDGKVSKFDFSHAHMRPLNQYGLIERMKY